MKKILITGTAVLFLMAACNVSAITVDITAMNLGSNSYVASGEFSSTAGDPYPHAYGSATGSLFGQPWDTVGVEFFDDNSGTPLHYAGINFTTGEDFDYAFTLSEGQVAWGLLVTWGGGNDHPILNIMDCGNGNPGDVCTGVGTPMQVSPFPGIEFSYDGIVSAVPVPAAAWLFSTGILGLIGLARRK